MSKKHRAPEPQSWGPRTPQGAAPPPGTWPEPPQGSPSTQPPGQGSAAPPPRKRHRVFLWVFLTVQLLFLAWVIVGATSASGTPEECRGLTGDDLDQRRERRRHHDRGWLGDRALGGRGLHPGPYIRDLPACQPPTSELRPVHPSAEAVRVFKFLSVSRKQHVRNLQRLP